MKIILEKVDLGTGKIEIPVANLKSRTDGPTVVITGGMDGDEYTGIQAAYQLIEYFTNRDFPGRLIILPLVNIPGFFAGKSLNPLDSKYPKYVYPGNSFGSSTLRLINWLDKKYLTGADLWLDLHSGAITETLTPFVGGYQTRNKEINKISENILANVKCKLKIFEKSSEYKTEKLAQQNISYIVFESGEKGEQNPSDILQMVTWVKQALDAFWNPKSGKKLVNYYQKVTYYKVNHQGLWEPNFKSKEVKKGELAGWVSSVDRKKKQEIKIKESGIILWAKSALFVNPGDELIAAAS